MVDEFYLAKITRICRDFGGEVIFDVSRIDWHPSREELDKYCRDLCKEIVLKYREFEKTGEYVFSQDVLYAKDRVDNDILAFSVGEGFTYDEIAATHGLEWALGDLIRKYRLQSIDFRFLAMGYKGAGDREDLPSPMENIVNL